MIKYIVACVAAFILATVVTAKELEAVENRRKAIVLEKNKEAAQERKERKEARMDKFKNLH